jgi:hypothetical protein
MFKVTIGLDNQAVLLGLQNQKSKPGHHILDKIHDTLQDFQVKQARKRGIKVAGYRRGKGRAKLEDGSMGWKEWELEQWCEVHFVWTPGHEEIEGNERADEEAQSVAKGESSTVNQLPPILRRKRLPISISATRQILKTKWKRQWNEEWAASPRHERAKKIDNSLLTDNYLHIISQLQRNQASILTQLRTGHVPLNQILHRIKRADSPECPHCRQGTIESLTHYLLFCPRYTRARALLQHRLPRNTLTPEYLLSDRKGIPHLLRFVSNTGRFRTAFGEVRPDDDFIIKEKEIKTKERPRKDHPAI